MEYSTCRNGAVMVNLVGELTSDGALIFPEALDQVFVRNGDGTINYIEVVVPPWTGTMFGGGTYRQTFTWASGKLASISKWTKQ